MNEPIQAIFENGVFRPELPVNIANGSRVSLRIDAQGVTGRDLSDVTDLLDTEYVDSCRARAGRGPSLEEAQKILSAFQGSLADRIAEERDER